MILELTHCTNTPFIRKEFVGQLRQIYSLPVFWSEAYFVSSCGGVTVEQLKRYVQQQDSPA